MWSAVPKVGVFLPAALAAALALACGPVDSAPAPAGGPPGYVPTPEAPEPPPEGRTPRRLRRLTSGEMQAVIGDLLGEPGPGLAGVYLPDPRVEGYDNDAVALGVSESKIEEIVMAAERVAAHLIAGDRLDRQAPCPPGEAPAACARAFARRAATLAWGRPPSDEELDRLAGVYQIGQQGEGEGHRGGLALVTQALLTSPNFLYRSELGADVDVVGGEDLGAASGAAPAGSVSLTAFETASALSFLLRGSRPDAPLLEAAERGELAGPQGREQQARRLLTSTTGRRQVERFLRGWLGLDDVAMINKDVGMYPFFSPRARRALDRELSTFVDHVLGAGSGQLDELLLADYTFPAPELAPFYGPELLGPPGDFERRPLDGERRRGLLSSPAFLAAHALIDHTNPVERGLMVRGRMFCQDVAPPPPDVLAETPRGPELTTRQRYEAHVRDPRCRTCHQLIDGLGFGFEQFDAAGRFRTHENGVEVDARGEIVGTDVDGPFRGPVELSRRLLRSAQFRRCFVEQLFRYSEGRAVEAADAPEIDHLASLFERSERRIDELFVRLVRRPGFVLRRSLPEQTP